jgi:hypothetical protein
LRLFARSARATAALLALAAAFVARPARAQEERQDILGSTHHRFSSPQNFAIELRLAPYLPDIDSDPSLHGCTPFAQVFGTSPSIFVGGEFDWQALRIPHFGTLGPGLGFGTVSFNANAPNAGGNSSGCLSASSGTSGESTSLTIYPGYLVAVLRVDVLWKDLGVPLVPYAKLGPAIGFWQAANTLGVSNSGGSKGEGYSLGSQLAIGVGLNLNVFDEHAARNFDETMGVNSTYLFGEFSDTSLNGLWIQSNALRVGAAAWTFGLAWEF